MKTETNKQELENISEKIKNKALELGFCDCGIAKPRFLEEEVFHLNHYLTNNYHAEMQYMANNAEKRLNPCKLVENAKSVIVVLCNYYSAIQQVDNTAPIISKYAYGKDYHFFVKQKLNELLQFIELQMGTVCGRAFTDSAPVLEKAWAKEAGLGWIGKNGCLITKKFGSYMFIGELIIDRELAYNQPFEKEFCGSCEKCITACPTSAIEKPYCVDGGKCISYLTIENKNEIPEKFHNKLNNRVFGCDICMEVCPWNKKIAATTEDWFQPKKKLMEMKKQEWLSLTKEEFNEIFESSPVKRVKYERFMQNIGVLQKVQSGVIPTSLV